MNFVLYVVLYSIAIIGFFAIALLVSIRKAGKEYNYFALFAALLGGWQLLQFIAQLLTGLAALQVVLLELSVALIAFVGMCFLFFAASVARVYVKRVPYLLGGVVVAISSFFSSSLQHASISKAGIAVPSIDVFYALPLAFAAGCVLCGLYQIARYLKNTPHRSKERRQAMTLLAGILQGTVLISLFSVFAHDNLASQIIIPLACLIAVLIIAYAIVYQGLFDIRLAIARTVGYILALGFIGLFYGAFIFIISSLSIFSHQTGSIQHIEYVTFALLSALVYSPAEKFFARVTNKIFFQDVYDAQELFNQLNKVLVANAELDKLLIKALDIISGTFKAEYSAVALTTSGTAHGRIVSVGSGRQSLSGAELDAITSKIDNVKNHASVIVTDVLANASSNELVRLLQKRDIAALVLLANEVGPTNVLGYVIMGPKKSGRPYDKKDAQVLEAIANEMVIAIQNALRFEEIEKFNVTLQEEIARATTRLRRANTRLEELDNTKDDFISMASHQLRTPLTSVKGYLSMVIEGDAGRINSTQSKMLSQAFGSAQRMVFLITDLLNVSRLKTGKFVIEPVPVDLSKMVQEEVEQLTEAASSKRLKLSYKKPAKFPEVMLDETKIRQVVMNFIDNAIYYTPAGGHIRIELEDKLQTVELRIIDDGIGVPKAEQHHLFTKFYRAANARQARPDGTGLGLFMAQKVIVAQGGSIIFSSKEGQGSTFGFVFSKSRLKPTEPVTPRSDKSAEAKAEAQSAVVVR